MKMEEWKECTLSDLGTIVGGATPSTKDSSNYENGSIAWITPKDLSTHTERFISHGERNITEKGLKSCSAQLMPPNSILFTSRAPIGYIAIAKNEVCTNQGFKSIVPNKDTDFMFLYYLLRYNKDNIENLGSGTTFKEVSGSTMRNVPVKVPPLPIQQKIAAILSSLDDKIELNNKINTNLEKQAQALFKKAFADKIDNVSDKDGKTLGSLIDIVDNRGKTPPSSNEKNDFPILDVGALNSTGRIIDYKNCTKYVDEQTYSTFFRDGHPQENDILLSTVGSLAQMKFFKGNKGCIAQNVVAFRTLNTSPFYLYEYLKYIKNDLLAYDIGSVQPSIKVTHIIKHLIYIPTNDELSKFDSFAKSITEEIYNNVCENERLISIRDTLLPKLMNGEILYSN
ncbi:restriction endonuclease subunit S [Treponema bryantii]|uniref:restriction endonuclease subunit S n=1 Tax=Treponema bryantii TaxID=163 RepID=UPI001E2827C3|nr:restriction endonuclease subunit S [Treponema bryantii]